MPSPIPVAILGFSSFDRKALGAYFKLAERGRHHYEWVLSIEDARLVIADADEAGVLDLLRKLGRVADALFIGAQAPPEAMAWMMRPIDRAQVLRELDSLYAARDHPRSAPMPLPLPPALTTTLRTIGSASLPEPRARRADDDQAERRESAPDARDKLPRRRREAQSEPLIVPRALLVDDSEVALHFLRRQLEGYGLQIDLARHSERALDLLTHHVYGIVFLDVDLGEDSRVDGLTLCHQIRHRLLHPGGKTPMVVMVSALRGPVDQVRGALAGAEAYLGKPLNLAELDRLLQRQGLVRQAPPLPAQTAATKSPGAAAPRRPR